MTYKEKLLFRKLIKSVWVNKKTLYIIIFILFSTISIGQTSNNIEPVVEEVVEIYKSKDNVFHIDSILKNVAPPHHIVYEGEFDDGFQKRYTDKNFDYDQTKPKTSIWQRIKEKINSFFRNLFKESDIDGINNATLWVFRILAVFVVGIALYFIIKVLWQKEGKWIFSKKVLTVNPDEESIFEHIHNIDFLHIINELEEKQEYRSALRHWFLFLLKNLVDKGLIEIVPENTNRDYLKMLEGKLSYGSFKKLTYIFDNVWYGKRSITSKEYNIYKNQYQNFIKDL